jgi:hypothetical protein
MRMRRRQMLICAAVGVVDEGSSGMALVSLCSV